MVVHTCVSAWVLWVPLPIDCDSWRTGMGMVTLGVMCDLHLVASLPVCAPVNIKIANFFLIVLHATSVLM